MTDYMESSKGYQSLDVIDDKDIENLPNSARNLASSVSTSTSSKRDVLIIKLLFATSIVICIIIWIARCIFPSITITENGTALCSSEGPFLYVTVHSGSAGISKYSLKDGCLVDSNILKGGNFGSVQLRSMFLGSFNGSEVKVVIV